MLSMMEQEKKKIFKKLHFCHVLYDGARKKKRFSNNSLWYHIIFRLLSLMEQEKKELLKNSFCYTIIFCMFYMIQQEKNNGF